MHGPKTDDDAARRFLMKPDVLEAIKASAAVPSMPQVVVRFLEVLADPNFTYDEVVRVLSADPGTVAEILRLANSPLFGVCNDVTSLTTALTLLGPKRTRSLVLGRYMMESMSARGGDALDMSYFWRRSLTCAVLASHMAGETLRGVREEVFIAALLADVGIPILAQSFPREYVAIAQRHAPDGRSIRADEERQAVQTTHAEVAGSVLEYWRLPDVVFKSVSRHQEPLTSDGSMSGRVARLIRGAECIADLLCGGVDAERIDAGWAEATQHLGQGAAILCDILPQVESDMAEIAGALRIDVIPSQVYAVVAREIQERALDGALA